MSKAAGILLGFILLGLGVVLMMAWWSYVVKALMALIPLILILTGTGILSYFVSEMKSQRDLSSSGDQAK